MIHILGRGLMFAVLLLLAGCNRPVQEPTEPTIAFVAASTKNAVQELATAFSAEKKGEVKINADDSAKLAQQIANDAPAHLFLSANEQWADFVNNIGFAKETVPLVGNTLVLVVPMGNPARIATPADLKGAGLKKFAVAGPNVPAGIYARQALKKMGLWDELESGKKIVPAENVRLTLTYVERGEAEAGIVYATDAKISREVETVYTFEAGTHDPIRYPLMLLKGSEKMPVAAAFFEYLKSSRGKEIFAKHGFSILDGK